MKTRERRTKTLTVEISHEEIQARLISLIQAGEMEVTMTVGDVDDGGRIDICGDLTTNYQGCYSAGDWIPAEKVLPFLGIKDPVGCVGRDWRDTETGIEIDFLVRCNDD